MLGQSMNTGKIIEIIENGTYYYPAKKHYNQNVVCDRCFKKDLDACIGYKKYDLCLNCVNDLIQIQKLKSKESHGYYKSIANNKEADTSELLDISPTDKDSADAHNLSINTIDTNSSNNKPLVLDSLSNPDEFKIVTSIPSQSFSESYSAPEMFSLRTVYLTQPAQPQQKKPNLKSKIVDFFK
jgi:hypothetical protein